MVEALVNTHKVLRLPYENQVVVCVSPTHRWRVGGLLLEPRRTTGEPVYEWKERLWTPEG